MIIILLSTDRAFLADEGVSRKGMQEVAVPFTHWQALI